MATSCVGFTKTNFHVGNSPWPVTGPNGAGADGPTDVLVKAFDAGIFIGNEDVEVNLPGSGFELIPDQEYRFSFHGSGMYLATLSEGNVGFSYFVSPHVA